MAAHEYTATVAWQRRPGESFIDNRYSRAHEWRFDGGTVVPASSSPKVVPPPLSDTAAVDPEEAFVAALSACHMLFFLFHAAKHKFAIQAYEDQASAVFARNSEGRTAMLKVTLRPRVTWEKEAPDAETLAQLHEHAHRDCYLANSVTAEVVVEPA